MRVHHHGRAARCSILGDADSQLALDQMLQILVDRQLQCRTGGGRALDSAERLAPGVSLDEHRTWATLDQCVVRRLDTAQSLVVDTHVPQHMRREFLVGIETAALLHETDAIQLEGGNTPRFVWRHLSFHVGERAATADPFGDGLPVATGAVIQGATERRRCLIRIGDVRWNGIDRCRIDAEGKYAAVAVEDVAPLGRHFHGPGLLVPGARGQIVVPDHLEVHQSRLNRRRPCDKNDGAGQQSALHRGAPERRNVVRHRPTCVRAPTWAARVSEGRAR